MQVCIETGPGAPSFHAANQPWRGPALALALHLTAAFLWLAWPAAPSTGDIAPVVELVFTPPPPAPPPPAPPQPAVTPVAAPPVAAQAKPAQAKPAPARPALVRPAAVAPVAVAASAAAPASDLPPVAAAAEPVRPAPEPPPPPVAADPDIKPTIADAPRPPYPRAARQRGMQGVVTLLVQVAEDGAPLAVTLKASSGHAMLDDAAQAAVRSWRFTPARRAGQPVAASVEVPVRFALNE